MQQRWKIVQKSDQGSFARSEIGRLVGLMTRNGLIGFLSSRCVGEPVIRGALDNLASRVEPSYVRLQLEDGWR